MQQVGRRRSEVVPDDVGGEPGDRGAQRRPVTDDAEIDRAVTTYARILKLNDDQAKSFRAVLVDGREQRRKVYKPGGDWRQARKDAREQQNKALEKALSPEQYQRYLEVSELERYER